MKIRNMDAHDSIFQKIVENYSLFLALMDRSFIS